MLRWKSGVSRIFFIRLGNYWKNLGVDDVDGVKTHNHDWQSDWKFQL